MPSNATDEGIYAPLGGPSAAPRACEGAHGARTQRLSYLRDLATGLLRGHTRRGLPRTADHTVAESRNDSP